MAPEQDGSGTFEVMPDDAIRRVELALDDLRAGRMVILIDDEDRENEGDLVLAAELVTPEAINFMAVHARGLICLSMTGEQVAQLEIPMMAQNNKSAYETAFTVSIEAREGVTTGISAADRAQTILTAVSPTASPRDIVVPGHIFPLRARSGGVLERTGQTEGSVDLARLAGLNPSGVICEIMNPDGTMSRLPELKTFGEEHNIRICAVADIIQYRLQRERMVEQVTEGTFTLPGMGEWSARLYRGVGVGGDHLALWKGQLDGGPALCRVQTAPPGWGSFGPGASRSSEILMQAARRIADEGRGALVLMHLASSSANLRQQFIKDSGGETQTPPPTRMDALRDLGAGCQILLDVGLTKLRLLSNTQRPVIGTEAYGIEIVEWLEVDV
jgi:3,4-dihydroxy 2-butanone 4-phosphate synthase/GTP cyclohydrolase II